MRVRGRVERFRDELQVEVRAIERAEAADPAAFLPVAYRDLDELDGFLEHLAREVHDREYRALLESLLADEALRADWRRAPCTRGGHHAYLGGLLEHTVAVGTLALEACQLHPRLNSDLLITAALVHDLGKTREFTYGADDRAVRGGPAARPRRARAADGRRARGRDERRAAGSRSPTACSSTTVPTPRRAGASARPRRSRCTGSTRSTRASRARWSTACRRFGAMPAYEYATAAISHGLMGRKSEEVDRAELEALLNERGAEGWELDKLVLDVAMHGEKDGHLVIFKRAR